MVKASELKIVQCYLASERVCKYQTFTLRAQEEEIEEAALMADLWIHYNPCCVLWLSDQSTV